MFMLNDTILNIGNACLNNFYEPNVICIKFYSLSNCCFWSGSPAIPCNDIIACSPFIRPGSFAFFRMRKSAQARSNKWTSEYRTHLNSGWLGASYSDAGLGHVKILKVVFIENQTDRKLLILQMWNLLCFLTELATLRKQGKHRYFTLDLNFVLQNQ